MKRKFSHEAIKRKIVLLGIIFFVGFVAVIIANFLFYFYIKKNSNAMKELHTRYESGKAVYNRFVSAQYMLAQYALHKLKYTDIKSYRRGVKRLASLLHIPISRFSCNSLSDHREKDRLLVNSKKGCLSFRDDPFFLSDPFYFIPALVRVELMFSAILELEKLKRNNFNLAYRYLAHKKQTKVIASLFYSLGQVMKYISKINDSSRKGFRHLVKERDRVDNIFSIIRILLISMSFALIVFVFYFVYHGVGKIIDKRKEAEDKSNIFHKFAEAAGQGFCMCSLDGRINYVNRSFLRMIGENVADQVLGCFLDEFYLDDDKQLLVNNIIPNVKKYGLIIDEMPLVSRAGQTTATIQTMFMINNDEETPICIAIVITDVDSLKYAEEEINKLNNELEKRVVERTLLLEETHKKLLEVSRRAGMAEVATNVLHNVGNVLNSVNVKVTLLKERMQHSEISNLLHVIDMIVCNSRHIDTFFKEDPRGKHIPVYLEEVSAYLKEEQEDTKKKLALLTDNVDHIKQIVQRQQSCAREGSLEVEVDISEVIEEALSNNIDNVRHGDIEVHKIYEQLPRVRIDKQKLVQILVNLICNACESFTGFHQIKKEILIRVYMHGKERFCIDVVDNGVGIPGEDLIGVFKYGFTTKKDGHGFGLHSGALFAKEMGGSLTVASKGEELGATFTLELPYKPMEVIA